jgi:integrase
MRFLKGLFRHWRAAVVMATCFADFLRFSEVLNIRIEDLTLAGSDLRFWVSKAKNHRLGFNVCLPVDDPESIGSFVIDFRLNYYLIKDLIKAIGLDLSKYSTHSAKTAAVVAGCTDGRSERWADGSLQKQESNRCMAVWNSRRD